MPVVHWRGCSWVTTVEPLDNCSCSLKFPPKSWNGAVSYFELLSHTCHISTFLSTILPLVKSYKCRLTDYLCNISDWDINSTSFEVIYAAPCNHFPKNDELTSPACFIPLRHSPITSNCFSSHILSYLTLVYLVIVLSFLSASTFHWYANFWFRS